MHGPLNVKIVRIVSLKYNPSYLYEDNKYAKGSPCTSVPLVSGSILRANVRMAQKLQSSKFTSAQIVTHAPLMVIGRRNHFESSTPEASAIFLCVMRTLLGYSI